MRLHPKEINVGDTFYESDYGIDVEMLCTEQPRQDEDNNKAWRFKAIRKDNSHVVDYLYRDDYPQYAPKLYNTPYYATPLEKRTHD